MLDKQTNSHSTPEQDSGVKGVRRQGEHKRTSRACDRCRFKKSKCDGLPSCMNCQSSERTCIYSARRRRDARKWYCGMQEIVDEAFQRLYQACREADAFPGTLPPKPNGRVTTEDILRGLGLAAEPGPFGDPEPQPNSATPQSEGAPTSNMENTERTNKTQVQLPRLRTARNKDSDRGLWSAPSVTVGSKPDKPQSQTRAPSQAPSTMAINTCEQLDDVMLTDTSVEVDFGSNAPLLAHSHDGYYTSFRTPVYRIPLERDDCVLPLSVSNVHHQPGGPDVFNPPALLHRGFTYPLRHEANIPVWGEFGTLPSNAHVNMGDDMSMETTLHYRV